MKHRFVKQKSIYVGVGLCFLFFSGNAYYSYCMSIKTWPISYSNLLYETGQDFLDT